jgi:hypothetical protein
MNEKEALRIADAGRANYVTDAVMSDLGHAGLWEMEHVGEEPCEPYVAHGNFWADTRAVFRSRLTDAGRARLASLENDVPSDGDATT